MFPRSLSDALLSLMLHLQGGLHREQTFRRLARIDPNLPFVPFRVGGEFLMIGLEVVPEEGELKSALSSKGAVALAGTAPQAAEHRDDMSAKTRLRGKARRVIRHSANRRDHEHDDDTQQNPNAGTPFH